MKLAVFLTVVTLAAVSSYRTNEHSALFRPGEQYVYHYKGQVLHGIPKSSEQHAGLHLDSIVILQFQQDNKVIMKLENIKLSKINNKISTSPNEPLPESDVTHVTGEQAHFLTESLVKPLKFRYVQGEVQELEQDVSDCYESVNIKKGILSLFQVTLKEKNQFSSASSLFDPTISRITSYNRRSQRPRGPYWRQQSDISNTVFDVMETDVTGTCETKYTVIPEKQPLTTGPSTMKVHAVRNFEKCVNKPFRIEGLFQGVYSFSEEKSLLQPVVKTDYIITGDQTHFLIKQAILRGKYMFLIRGLEGADMSSHIVQSLTLKSTQPISTPIQIVSTKTVSRGLEMVIPKPPLVSHRENYDNLRGLFYGQREQRPELIDSEEEEVVEQTFNIVPVVERKLDELVHCVYTAPEGTKCSTILFKITHMLRQANKQQLKALLRRYVRAETSTMSETDYRKAEILLDVLPTLSSPASATVLVELIRERQITPIRGQLLLKAMSLTVLPKPAIIKKVLELFKELPKESSSRSLNEMTLLRQAALLSVGTLTNRLINVMRSQGRPLPGVITFIDSISMELKRMLKESSSESEKILILKSMGNMGASETIIILKNLVEDRRQLTKIRVSAIFALRRLASQFKKQVIPILMGVYMDVKEARELRQGAFVVLINSNPSYTTLQMIAHRLRDEPSSQLRTLVYSTLINLASYTSHQPEHKQLVKNARLIVKTIPSVSIGVYDSMSLQLSKFIEEYDLGGVLNVIKIKSKLSGLPEAVIANLQGTLFGKHKRLLEVGVQGKSLEVILRKIFGPHGLLKEILKGQVSLNDVFRPLSRPDMGEIRHKMRELLNKMMLELRSEEEPLANWYIHILGHELQYIALNSQNVQELVSKVTRYIPELWNKLSQGLPVDVIKTLSHQASMTVASPLGIPLSLNFSTNAIAKVDGHVKIRNLPTWSDLLNRLPTTVPDISVDVNLKPMVDVSKCFGIESHMKWISSGVVIHAKVEAKSPVKLSAQLDGQQHSISVKYFTPKQTIRTLHAQVVPLTYVSFVPTTVNNLPFQLEIKEIRNDKIVKRVPFEKSYTCSVTGLEFKFHGVYSFCGPNWCPISPLFGNQELLVVTRPFSSVEYVHMKIKSLRTNFQFDGVPASHSTEWFYRELEQGQSSLYRSSHQMTEVGEFEPITVDPVFKSDPIKRQLLITIGPNNAQSPKMKQLITWLMSRSYVKHQINYQALRPAHSDMPSWKVHANNVFNGKVWYSDEQYIGERGEFLNKLHFIWKINGEAKEIKCKIIPRSPFDFTQEVKQHSLLVFEDLPVARAQKYKYTLEVDLPQMSHKVMEYLTVIKDAVKYQLYSKITTSIPRTPLPNKVIVAVELLPRWEKMNVIIKTPRENNYISSLPFYWNPFLPTNQKMRLHDSLASSYFSQLSDQHQAPFLDTVPYKASPLLSRGICHISWLERTIKTFDGIKINNNHFQSKVEGGCAALMAQDCSSQSLFSLTGEGENLSSWSETLLLPQTEFKIIGRGNHITVLANGQELSLRQSQPVLMRNDLGEVLYEVEDLGNGNNRIKAHKLGLTLYNDAQLKTTTFKISPWSVLQGQLCGLCGNYNQDQSDEFQVPPNLKIPSDRNAMFSYLIPSDTCDIDRQGTTYSTCVKSDHVTVRRYDNGIEMTCKSEAKIPQCGAGCQPESTRIVKTCFSCLSTETRSISPYRPSRWDSVLGEQDTVQCSDFFQYIHVPTRCVPVF